jgi:hypothetical protein
LIFCQQIAWNHRNACLLLRRFVEKVGRPSLDLTGPVGSKLATAAVFVDDPVLTQRVTSVLGTSSEFGSRLASAWLSLDTAELSKLRTEIAEYIHSAEIKPWADTWHHLLLRAMRAKSLGIEQISATHLANLAFG